MKKVGFIFAFLLIFFQGKAQCIRILENQEKVLGKVSSITEIQLTSKSDGTATDSLIIERKYDKKGNTVQEKFSFITHYPPNVDVIDADGNKINKTQFRKFLIYNYSPRYKANGQNDLICIASGTKYVYTFDKQRILIGNKEYQSDGRLDRTYSYKYDNRHHLLCIESYNYQGILYEQVSYVYNAKNLLGEEERQEASEKNINKTTYTYVDFDKSGNWVKRRQQETEGDYITDKIVTRTIKYRE